MQESVLLATPDQAKTPKQQCKFVSWGGGVFPEPVLSRLTKQKHTKQPQNRNCAVETRDQLIQ